MHSLSRRTSQRTSRTLSSTSYRTPHPKKRRKAAQTQESPTPVFTESNTFLREWYDYPIRNTGMIRPRMHSLPVITSYVEATLAPRDPRKRQVSISRRKTISFKRGVEHFRRAFGAINKSLSTCCTLHPFEEELAAYHSSELHREEIILGDEDVRRSFWEVYSTSRNRRSIASTA